MPRLVIPNRVYIRGKWWPVIRGVDLDGESCPGHPKSQIEYDGLVDNEHIYLSHKILGRRVERVTLIHEILHAVALAEVLPADKEEAFIESIDSALLTTLEKLHWE